MTALARTGADIARLRRLARADEPGEPIEELSMAVVGVRFGNKRRKGQPTGNRQTEILMCERGEPVVLQHEATNKHDANAIAVYSARGVQLGYLSADKTAIVHRANGEGRQPAALFQEVTPWGAWIRVAFGREPTLPAVREVRPGCQPKLSCDDWDGVDDLPPDD